MLTGQPERIRQMYKFFVIIVWAMAVCGLWPQTAMACETTDKVILGVWPGHLGLIKIFAAENITGEDGVTIEAKYCLDFEMAPFTDISQFDIALQQGVSDGVFVSTDANSFAANRTRVLEVGGGEKGVIVAHLANATYGLYARRGFELGSGSRIAVARCGWQDRELTEPVPAKEATEALSGPTLVMLPWLRAEGYRIWCGLTPPADFQGVQLVPVGTAGKREAAFADRQNGIDFVVQTIERATARTMGDNAELDLLAGPEKLRSFPEGLLIAREGCLSDDVCADVVWRTVTAIEEAGLALLSGGEAVVSRVVRDYAAAAGEKTSIKGADNEAVAMVLARYLIAHELPQIGLSRPALLEMIDENGWEEAVPEDLIASFVELE